MLRNAMLLMGALLIPATAMAQPGWGNDVGQYRHEGRQDRAEIRDDLRDARRLEDLAARFDQARWANRYGELFQIENELRVLVRGELEESRREIRDDRREMRDDRYELRPGEWREGRNDRRDDVRDFQAERASLMRRFEVARELDLLFGRMDWQAMNRKRALIGELIVTARQEIREDFQEVREDRYERWDDRWHNPWHNRWHNRWERRHDWRRDRWR